MVWISVQSHSGDIQVDVMRDGTLCGVNGELDDVLAYDLSMVEFGEEKSELLHFIDQWNDKKLNVLISYIPLSNETMVLLAADIAEHVYSIYSKYYQTEDISDVFNKIRLVMNGELPTSVLGRTMAFINDFKKDLSWKPPSVTYVLNAVFKVIHMTQNIGSWIKKGPLPGESDTIMEKALMGYEKHSLKAMCIEAQEAVAMDSDYPPESQEWAFEGQKEETWQIRRIVDVLDEIRSGRPWPPLSATE